MAKIDSAGFLRTLAEHHLLEREDLAEVAEEIEDGASLLDAVVEGGFLTRDQVKRVSWEIQTVGLVCLECRGRVRVKKKVALGKFPCPDCNATISVAGRTAVYAEALIKDHPRQQANQLLLKLAVREGILVDREIPDIEKECENTLPVPRVEELIAARAPEGAQRLQVLVAARDRHLLSKYPDFESLRDDVDLARFLVRLGLAGVSQLNKSLSLQTLESKKGRFRPLRQMLLDANLLTGYQVDVFLPGQYDRKTMRVQLMNRDPLLKANVQKVVDDILDDDDDLDDDDLMAGVSGGEDTDLNVLSLEDDEPETKLDPKAFQPGAILEHYVKKTYGKGKPKPGRG